MQETAFEKFTGALTSHGCDHHGQKWICPAHEDREPSLSVNSGVNGMVLFKCHAGCDWKDIVTALDLTPADIRTEVARYAYRDAAGNVINRKIRYSDKKFQYEHSQNGSRLPLYNLPEVILAVAQGRRIWVVEGEKDADRLTAMGEVATTNPNGASEWHPEYTDILAGADVVIVADKDDPGVKHARLIESDLRKTAKSVRVVQSLTSGKGADVSDHLDAGLFLEDLVPLDRPANSIASKYSPVNWAEAFKRQPEDVDWLFPPILETGTTNALFGKPGVGKALSLDTPLPTPAGWTTMGEVRIGDYLFGADGSPVKILAATEVMRDRPCYEIEFDDGTIIVADAEHQWMTETRGSRLTAPSRMQIRTTQEIAATLMAGDHRNHSVVLAKAMVLPGKKLPIEPYAFGVWLGDGDSSGAVLTTADQEILENLAAAGVRTQYRITQANSGKASRYRMFFSERIIRPAKICGRCGRELSQKYPSSPNTGYCMDCYWKTSSRGILRELGVLHDKHIPLAYLRSSEEQRRALLAGLLDTDGTVGASGTAQFCSVSRKLAENVRELILSLGYRCGWSEKKVKGRSEATSTAYILSFMTRDKVFRLPRKEILHGKRLRITSSGRSDRRYITEVREISSVPVRCVQVEGGIYLASRSMIPTHNSLITLEIAMTLVREGKKVMYLDDENRVMDTVDRLKSFGCKPDELSGLVMYSFVGLPPLDTPDGGEHLAALADLNHPDLVILDTTTRMVEGDENSANTFLQLYRCSLVPLKQRGITVLRLDHPGKDDRQGQRGSSAKDGDVDSIWRLAHESDDMLVLERLKSRSGHGEGFISVKRLTEPILCHDWQALDKMPVTPQIEEWARRFDRWEVPRDAGRPTLRAAMKEHNVDVDDRKSGVSTTMLALIAKHRKAQAARDRQGQSDWSPSANAESLTSC